MAERKVNMVVNGKPVTALEIPVIDSREPWAEYTLEDGTVFRMKTVVQLIGRVEGQWDDEGNPLYVVKSNPSVTLVTVPEQLRRKK